MAANELPGGTVTFLFTDIEGSTTRRSGGTDTQGDDRAVADAKAALGEEAFAAAWARSEGMTAEEIAAAAAGAS